MQKLDEKLNANAVGATSSCPHFEGMTINKQKGITLIALIITIIVMLILVGVTINVALNGGLFQKAETATTETKKTLEKEELIQIVVGEYDVKSEFVNANNVRTQIAEKYTEDTSKSKEGKTLVVQGETGVLWEINLETAEVKEYKEETKIVYNKAYVLQDTDTETYLILSSNGILKQVMPEYGDEGSTELNFEVRENVEMVIDGETITYEIAVFTNIFDKTEATEDDLLFTGYITNEGADLFTLPYYVTIEGNVVSNVNTWAHSILDETIEVSEYL